MVLGCEYAGTGALVGFSKRGRSRCSEGDTAPVRGAFGQVWNACSELAAQKRGLIPPHIIPIDTLGLCSNTSSSRVNRDV